MLKSRTLWTIFVFVLGLFPSCQKQEELLNDSFFYHWYTSYVYLYHVPYALFLVHDNVAYADSLGKIAIVFDIQQQISRESDKILYNHLGEKHNDTSYERKIANTKQIFPHNYLSVDLLSISVTSNVDYDELHPAGTLLNDIIQYTAYSPYEYIQSGYNPQVAEVRKINKLLPECLPEDFILTLARNYEYFSGEIPVCNLHFHSLPTLAKQHTLTVTVMDDSGKTWEASIEMDWSEG